MQTRVCTQYQWLIHLKDNSRPIIPDESDFAAAQPETNEAGHEKCLLCYV